MDMAYDRRSKALCHAYAPDSYEPEYPMRTLGRTAGKMQRLERQVRAMHYEITKYYQSTSKMHHNDTADFRPAMCKSCDYDVHGVQQKPYATFTTTQLCRQDLLC